MELRKTLVREPSHILAASFEGARQWIIAAWDKQVISPKLAVVFGSTHEVKKQLLIQEQLQSSDPLPMPYVSVVPALWERSATRGNAFAMKRYGVQTGAINQRTKEVRERIIPVDVGLGVRFVTRNVEEARMFASIWLQAGPIAGFAVKSQHTGHKIRIQMGLDPQINQGEADFGGEVGDLTKIDTTLILRTYAGDTELNTLIQNIRLAFRAKRRDDLADDLTFRGNTIDEQDLTLEERAFTYRDIYQQRFGGGIE